MLILFLEYHLPFSDKISYSLPLRNYFSHSADPDMALTVHLIAYEWPTLLESSSISLVKIKN